MVLCRDAVDSPFPVSRREKDYLTERQELTIDFIFCLVLIEVLTKLSVHPVPESFIHTIEDYAFKHFKQQESLKDRLADRHVTAGLGEEHVTQTTPLSPQTTPLSPLHTGQP